MANKLDFSVLQKALQSLQEAIDFVENDQLMSGLTDSQKRTVRAGVIQNFEFSYELSWKMLRRQLILEEGEESVKVLSRKDLFRLAAQKALLDDPEQWFVYHQARNETSHTYDEKKADDVLNVCLAFLPSALDLLAKLEAR